jgi:flagellar basal-body rod protein FlgG
LYSAATGMVAQQHRIDAVSNDLANASTAGYQKQRLAFRDLAYTDVPTGQGVRAGAGAAVSVVGRSQAVGSIERTEQPLDVAVEGEGYLLVRRTDGREALTRQGSLRIDTDRRLVTATGELLVPQITIPEDVDVADISIGPDGTLRAGERELGRIELRTVPAPQGLLSVGDSMLVPTAASGPLRAATGTLQQGALESSNVDMAEAMVELMEAQRTFTLASRAVQTHDQLLEIANGVKR